MDNELLAMAEIATFSAAEQSSEITLFVFEGST